VESLVISVDGITRVSFDRLKLLFSNALNKIVAADLPIPKAGWVTVLNVGHNINAACRLVKLITFILSGIESFKSLQAR
jgi:hypothetical protein